MCLSRDGHKPRLCRGGGRRPEPCAVQQNKGIYWKDPWMLFAFVFGELCAVGHMDLQCKHLHMFPAQTSWDAASFCAIANACLKLNVAPEPCSQTPQGFPYGMCYILWYANFKSRNEGIYLHCVRVWCACGPSMMNLLNNCASMVYAFNCIWSLVREPITSVCVVLFKTLKCCLEMEI